MKYRAITQSMSAENYQYQEFETRESARAWIEQLVSTDSAYTGGAVAGYLENQLMSVEYYMNGIYIPGFEIDLCKFPFALIEKNRREIKRGYHWEHRRVDYSKPIMWDK